MAKIKPIEYCAAYNVQAFIRLLFMGMQSLKSIQQLHVMVVFSLKKLFTNTFIVGEVLNKYCLSNGTWYL